VNGGDDQTELTMGGPAHLSLCVVGEDANTGSLIHTPLPHTVSPNGRSPHTPPPPGIATHRVLALRVAAHLRAPPFVLRRSFPPLLPVLRCSLAPLNIAPHRVLALRVAAHLRAPPSVLRRSFLQQNPVEER
jgi:hypothetical protein